ncbi:calpain family cysteine protease (macronuclear) [Tetrahymena thermophila SB210]|uniref:Calpain family cysteine protease n=1 Tax=Tetrahymena thermophila (strain SB210) TaxID=312017 RepID=I7MJR3_TETTS|nr:calpain family cysteine protease [Tetrahymena thermophila SB210]EAS07113.1 calpain family cysteine protease [Tetrahymena thermophila SB210]|eukprot:XP_001027355.1 calpain family cysteine protease [Tetrahymena thermophila SB210]
MGNCLHSKEKKKEDNKTQNEKERKKREPDALNTQCKTESDAFNTQRKTEQNVLNTKGIKQTSVDCHLVSSQPSQFKKNNIMQQNDKKSVSSKDNFSQKQQNMIQQEQLFSNQLVQVTIKSKNSQDGLSNRQIGYDNNKKEQQQQNTAQAQSLSQIIDQKRSTGNKGSDIIIIKQNNIEQENQSNDDFSFISQTIKNQQNNNEYDDKLSKQNSINKEKQIQQNQNLFYSDNEFKKKNFQQEEEKKQENSKKEINDFVKEIKDQSNEEFGFISQTIKKQENNDEYDDKLSQKNSINKEKQIQQNQNLFINESEFNKKDFQQEEEKKQENSKKEINDFVKEIKDQSNEELGFISQTIKKQENNDEYDDKLSQQNSINKDKKIQQNQNLFISESEFNKKDFQQEKEKKQENSKKEINDFIKSQINQLSLIENNLASTQKIQANTQKEITNFVNKDSQNEEFQQQSSKVDENSKIQLSQSQNQLQEIKIAHLSSQHSENGNLNLLNEQEPLNSKAVQVKQNNLDQIINIDNKLSENQKNEQSLKEIETDEKQINISYQATNQLHLIDNNKQIQSNVISNQKFFDTIDSFSSQQQKTDQNNVDKLLKNNLNKSTQFPDENLNDFINKQQNQDSQKTEIQIEGEKQTQTKQEKEILIQKEDNTQNKCVDQIQVQDEEEISSDEQIETEEIFTDKEFPPLIESISYDQVAYINQLLEKQTPLVFKRVNEVIKDGKVNLFFNDTTSIYDVKQGLLGDCYFIVCMIVLSQYPNVIKSLFRNQSYNEKGKYILNLIKNGKSVKVVVDDYLPCYQDSRGFAFAQSPNNVAIWPSLLEKAMAKLHKNYLNIEGNNENKLGPSTSAVLMHLVGCPSQQTYFGKEKTNSFKDIEEAWAKILESFNKGYLQTTGVSKSEFTGEKALDNGLVANHAYSIIEVRQFDKLKLIKLKNPWAKTEWKLDWSDESTCWTEELKQQVNLEVKDDGIFWMSFQDFYQNFSYVNVAFFNPSYQYSFLEIKNEDYFALFQYDLYVEEAGEDIEGSLILSQISERYLPRQDHSSFKTSSISFCVFEMDKEKNKPTELKYTVCQNSEMIFQQVKLERGKKYSIVIIVDFLRPYSKDIVLSFYGNQKINFQKKNLIRQAQLKIFCDYIDTVKDMQPYDQKWPIYKYQILIGSIFVFAIRNNTNNQRFVNEIEFTSSSLVTECLKYNESIEYQEIEKNKYKVIVPSGQTLKWIFKQSSFQCNNTQLGMSQLYRVLPEKFLSEEEIEKQIPQDSEKILVSEGIDGQISMLTLNLPHFIVYKYINTTKDKTYVQLIKFDTKNMRFLNSNDFEMNDERYHKIIVPPSSSIYLKFESMIINGIADTKMQRSFYQYQLI